MKKDQTIMLPNDTKNLKFCLGWDTDCDIDASIICCDDNGQFVTDCNYGNKEIDGFKHVGDNLTGYGRGDDETIIITLNEISKRVQ